MSVIDQQSLQKRKLTRMTSADLTAAVSLSRDVGRPHRLENWQFCRRSKDWLLRRRPIGAGRDVVALRAPADADRHGRRRSQDAAVRHRPVALHCHPRPARYAFGPKCGGGGRAALSPASVLKTAEPSASIKGRRGQCRPRCIVPESPFVFRSGEMWKHGSIWTRPPPAFAAKVSSGRRAGTAKRWVLDADGRTVGFASFASLAADMYGRVVAQAGQAARALIAHWIGSKARMFLHIDVPEVSGPSGWLDELAS